MLIIPLDAILLFHRDVVICRWYFPFQSTFLWFQRRLGVSGCLPSVYILTATAHAPRILTSVHTPRSSKALTKMLNVAGRRNLVNGWNRLSFIICFCFFFNSRTLLPAKCRLVPRLVARHGAEEIHLGHRASPQELRSRVGNSVDHGPRWGSCTDTRCCWSPGSGGGGLEQWKG